MDDIELGDFVVATFAPLRTDDLCAEALSWIGVKTRWYAAWLIEEGAYAGQCMMGVMDYPPGLRPMGGVPLCDLRADES